MCITAGQIQWTQDVTKALAITKERGDKRALKSMKKKQVKLIDKKSFTVPNLIIPLEHLIESGYFKTLLQ